MYYRLIFDMYAFIYKYDCICVRRKDEANDIWKKIKQKYLVVYLWGFFFIETMKHREWQSIKSKQGFENNMKCALDGNQTNSLIHATHSYNCKMNKNKNCVCVCSELRMKRVFRARLITHDPFILVYAYRVHSQCTFKICVFLFVLVTLCICARICSEWE